MSRFLVTAAEVPRWGRLPRTTAAAGGGRICWLILPRSQISTMNLRSQAPGELRQQIIWLLPLSSKSNFFISWAFYQIDV